jgi:hypothetical protein
MKTAARDGLHPMRRSPLPWQKAALSLWSLMSPRVTGSLTRAATMGRWFWSPALQGSVAFAYDEAGGLVGLCLPLAGASVASREMLEEWLTSDDSSHTYRLAECLRHQLAASRSCAGSTPRTYRSSRVHPSERGS